MKIRVSYILIIALLIMTFSACDYVDSVDVPAGREAPSAQDAANLPPPDDTEKLVGISFSYDSFMLQR